MYFVECEGAKIKTKRVFHGDQNDGFFDIEKLEMIGDDKYILFQREAPGKREWFVIDAETQICSLLFARSSNY